VQTKGWYKVNITLKEIRELKGFSQEEVASDLGISVSYLSLLENGKRRMSIENAQKLANKLGVTLEKIFFAYNVCRMSTTQKNHKNHIEKRMV